MSLSHELHMEQHQIGVKAFLEKYLVKPIYLDEETIIDLGLMTRKQIRDLDEGR